MTDKEKIKAEIEKRIEILSGTHAGRSSDVIIALEEIVSFIDSMQETEFKETEVLKRKLSNIAKAIYEHKGPENPTVEHIREMVQDCCFELMDLEKEHVDYDKLDAMLDDALSKETKESWNERLDGEELVSKVWHDIKEPPKFDEIVVLRYVDGLTSCQYNGQTMKNVLAWAYYNDIVNL